MIRRIQIDNFKSLDGFSLPPAGSAPMARLTLLTGVNGTGKTSVLQVLDFLCSFMRGAVGDWFKDRGWAGDILSSSFESSPWGLFSASVSIQLDAASRAEWSVTYNQHTGECDEEMVVVNGQTLLKAKDGNVDFEDKGNSRPLRGVSLPGSAMGILRIASAPNPLGSIKDLFGKNIASFELLSTDALKTQSARSRSIGRRGENMAGFSADLYRDTQARINERMQEFCPGVQRIYVDQDLPSKLYRQHIREDLLTEAVASSHFGDGFTRILAIVTQIESSTVPDRMLLIDGIEDGIHPELLPKLIGYLAGSNAQVIATTQSPIVLNCLPEDEARESVIFLYRNGEGRSRSCRYFDLPSANSKLGILRPGEIFADTAAAQLAREAEEMERAASTRE